MRLLPLQTEDHGFHLIGKLIGIAHRPARPVRQCLDAVLAVAIENLVAGLARDAELPAQLAHALAVQQTADETHTLIHHRTLSPRHQHLPPKRGKCYPCVRYKPSPMSRVGQVAASPVSAARFPNNSTCIGAYGSVGCTMTALSKSR